MTRGRSLSQAAPWSILSLTPRCFACGRPGALDARSIGVMSKFGVITALLFVAAQAEAQGLDFSGKRLEVAFVDNLDAGPSIEVEYVRVIDESSYEISIYNGGGEPISVVATTIFYGPFGEAFFVNGGLDEHTGEIAWQVPAGATSQHVTRCVSARDSGRDFDGGSYNCLKGSGSLERATRVMVVITDVYVDRVDRD